MNQKDKDQKKLDEFFPKKYPDPNNRPKTPQKQQKKTSAGQQSNLNGFLQSINKTDISNIKIGKLSIGKSQKGKKSTEKQSECSRKNSTNMCRSSSEDNEESKSKTMEKKIIKKDDKNISEDEKSSVKSNFSDDEEYLQTLKNKQGKNKTNFDPQNQNKQNIEKVLENQVQMKQLGNLLKNYKFKNENSTRKPFKIDEDLMIIFGRYTYINDESDLQNTNFFRYLVENGFTNNNRSDESLRDRFRKYLSILNVNDMTKILEYAKKNKIKGYLNFDNDKKNGRMFIGCNYQTLNKEQKENANLVLKVKKTNDPFDQHLEENQSQEDLEALQVIQQAQKNQTYFETIMQSDENSMASGVQSAKNNETNKKYIQQKQQSSFSDAVGFSDTEKDQNNNNINKNIKDSQKKKQFKKQQIQSKVKIPENLSNKNSLIKQQKQSNISTKNSNKVNGKEEIQINQSKLQNAQKYNFSSSLENETENEQLKIQEQQNEILQENQQNDSQLDQMGLIKTPSFSTIGQQQFQSQFQTQNQFSFFSNGVSQNNQNKNLKRNQPFQNDYGDEDQEESEQLLPQKNKKIIKNQKQQSSKQNNNICNNNNNDGIKNLNNNNNHDSSIKQQNQYINAYEELKQQNQKNIGFNMINKIYLENIGNNSDKENQIIQQCKEIYILFNEKQKNFEFFDQEGLQNYQDMQIVEKQFNKLADEYYDGDVQLLYEAAERVSYDMDDLEQISQYKKQQELNILQQNSEQIEQKLQQQRKILKEIKQEDEEQINTQQTQEQNIEKQLLQFQYALQKEILLKNKSKISYHQIEWDENDDQVLLDAKDSNDIALKLVIRCKGLDRVKNRIEYKELNKKFHF